MARFNRQSVESLCSFVDERVRQQGCDHTHRFSREWAAIESVGWDDLNGALRGLRQIEPAVD
jgi:hypothetical protein